MLKGREQVQALALLNHVMSERPSDLNLENVTTQFDQPPSSPAELL
jgi:hypothetical protein